MLTHDILYRLLHTVVRNCNVNILVFVRCEQSTEYMYQNKNNFHFHFVHIGKVSCKISSCNYCPNNGNSPRKWH